MTGRERICAIYEGDVPDRIGIHDSIWPSTLERWREEGLPEGQHPLDHLGVSDIARIGGDDTFRFECVVFEEDDTSRVYLDANGVTRRDLKIGSGWTPQWLDYTIKDRSSWEAHRDRLVYDDDRIKGALATYQAARDAGKYLMYSGHICFHPVWHWVGQERELLWMIESPDLLQDMFQRFVQLDIDIYEGFKAHGVVFDGVFMADDMGYKNGTMFSPSMYRDLVMPHHKDLCDHFSADGLPVTLHSDGDIRAFIPMMIEAGFTGLHPLEAKAGIHVRDIKEAYGDQLVLHGNIDVRNLAGSRADVEREIRDKVSAGKVGGGYIYHSDHSVPDDVSWDNYVYAVELLQEYGSY
jgi:uroporphyrinogen decarboxylase